MNLLGDPTNRRKFVLSVGFMCILSCPAPVFGQSAPLSLVQIQKLLQINSPDDLIAQEIRSRGVNFVPTAKTLGDLQKLGAGQETLAAVRERMPVGTLEVDALPGSQITLDGKEQGLADSEGRLVLHNIPAGVHVLSVQNSGYNTGEFNITLASKEYKRFPVTLEWSGGYLSVRTEPAGATINVSSLGQYKDSVSDLRCPPGTYSLTITRAGMKTETRQVVVVAGEHALLEVRLIPDQQYFQTQLEEAKLGIAHRDPRGAIRILIGLLDVEPNNADLEGLLAEAYLQTHDLARFQSAAESSIGQGGNIVLDLVHEHWEFSGESIHPAKLTLTANTIRYDPMGALCKYHTFVVPVSKVVLAEVTNKSSSGILVVRHLAPGTFVLHMEIEEPDKPGRRMTFYFGTSDSQIIRQNNIGLLSSPSNSSEVLGALVQLIQNTKQNAGGK